MLDVRLQARSLTFAAIALAAGLACAQGEMKGPPQSGLLEGQAPPQGPVDRSARPMPMPKAALASGPLETMIARNATGAPAWVTLRRGDRIDRGSCLAPGEERIWPLPPGADRVAWQVRGQVTRDPQCRAPVDCDASIDRRPGMTAVELRAGPRGCAWSIAALKAQGAPAAASPGRNGRQIVGQVENKSAAYIWVMLLTPPRRGTMELLDTMCLEPHGVSGFGVYEGRSYVVEASVRSDDNCMMAAGCESRSGYVGSLQPVRFEGNERTCRWTR